MSSIGQNIGTLPLKVDKGQLFLIDQRLLPEKLELFDATNLESMCFAISDMVVRGAPSIGIAAGYALAIHAKELVTELAEPVSFLACLDQARLKLQKTRPTAVNLAWATNQIYTEATKLIQVKNLDLKLVPAALFALAERLFSEQLAANIALSSFGQSLIPQAASILTHCNAGSLAACGWGTALGVIRSHHFNGGRPTVYVDETRPRNQGSKLTVWELRQDHIPCTLICDSLAGYLMSQKKVDLVLVGADRIATNGDTANKVGTYSLAALAHAHNIPFYVAAPLSTVDPTLSNGQSIELEERSAQELTRIGNDLITLNDVPVLNLAFDITPHHFISSIITEYGVLRPPYKDSIAGALSSKQKSMNESPANKSTAKESTVV